MINIYVGNLPYNTSEGDLETLFGQYGTVIRASIIMDRETGRSRGFGFVEMDDPEIGRKAIEALAGQPYHGRNLTINEAKAREPRKGGFASGGGAYGRPTGGGYANYGNAPRPRTGGYANPATPDSDDEAPAGGYRGYSNNRTD